MAGTAARRQLLFAAVGVLVAAADTYVVVVALPAIMDGVGLSIGELQRATPIVTGYLLGYVALLPLIGRLSDLVGRLPVLAGCLAAFSVGSFVSATARTPSLLVCGRAIAGLGGGGLLPVTLALVAEHWPTERRALPLGVVAAVQELGSVVGPLYGASLVALAGWRWIFWLNLPLAAVVAAGLLIARPSLRPVARPARPDVFGASLLMLGCTTVGLALAAPSALANGVTIGALYAPAFNAGPWSVLITPMAIGGLTLLAAFLAWEATGAQNPLVPLRSLPGAIRATDLPGAALLSGALACVVVSFSTANPTHQVVASSAPVLGPFALACMVGVGWRQHRARSPLLDPAAIRPRASWGAALLNVAAGAGLMTALVDVPFFARATIDPNSQLGAALVLLRFLAAVPVGAVTGGVLGRRPGREPAVAGCGLALSAAAFVAMSAWGSSALSARLDLGGMQLPLGVSDVELAACGLGFGLAIAPVNAAVLAAVPTRVHGLATSLVVVARTVGMLIGLSALTAIALHRFYQVASGFPSAVTLCPANPASCPPYENLQTAAILTELHTVFLGAAVCTGLAAVLCVLLRPTPTSTTP